MVQDDVVLVNLAQVLHARLKPFELRLLLECLREDNQTQRQRLFDRLNTEVDRMDRASEEGKEWAESIKQRLTAETFRQLSAVLAQRDGRIAFFLSLGIGIEAHT